MKKERSVFEERFGEDMRFRVICLLASAAAGAVLSGMKMPFAVSLAAALTPLCSLSAFVGAAAAALISGEFWGRLSITAAMAVMVICSFAADRFSLRSASSARAIGSGLAYFAAGCALTAVNDVSDWVVFAAVFFRSLLCGAATLCFTGFGEAAADGLGDTPSERKRRLFSVGAVYAALITALCGAEIDPLNIGRIAAAVVCIAAARKFGAGAAACVGVLSSAGFMLADPSLGRCGALLSFGAMAAGLRSGGIISGRSAGKYSVDVTFIISVFAATAAVGMPSGTPEFAADMAAAAVIYCLVPERLYISRLNGIFSGMLFQDSRQSSADRMMFAANILKGVSLDAQNASDMLSDIYIRQNGNAAETVRRDICGTCRERVCSAAFGFGSQDIAENCFRAAQAVCESKGQITEKELPTGFEGCREKKRIAQRYCRENAMLRERLRRSADSRRLLESALEQIGAECSMLGEMTVTGFCEDTALTDSARKLMEDCGFEPSSVFAAADGDRAVCTAYFYGGKLTSGAFSEVTEGLGSLFGSDMEPPEVFGEKEMLRVNWCGGLSYYPDCRVESAAAEGVCGDSHISFEDGCGNFYLILSDGMGRGGRASAQSRIAVNMLRRLILSGMGCVSAVRTLNVLMNAVSPDEVFATIDLLSVDLFTGDALLLKMGAAPTYIISEEQISVLGTSSAPVGIIGSPEPEIIRTRLTEHSRLIMATDGIGTGCDQYIRALLGNRRLTGEQMAEKLMAFAAAAETGDDMTVGAVRIYAAYPQNTQEREDETFSSEPMEDTKDGNGPRSA